MQSKLCLFPELYRIISSRHVVTQPRAITIDGDIKRGGGSTAGDRLYGRDNIVKACISGFECKNAVVV